MKTFDGTLIVLDKPFKLSLNLHLCKSIKCSKALVTLLQWWPFFSDLMRTIIFLCPDVQQIFNWSRNIHLFPAPAISISFLLLRVNWIVKHVPLDQIVQIISIFISTRFKYPPLLATEGHFSAQMHLIHSEKTSKMLLELLTEIGAVFKMAQNTFNIKWRRLPVTILGG